jgi:hypothetical protein
MRKLLLLLLCLPFIGFGQMATPSVLASSGDSYSNGGVIMDFTLGEIVVETFQPTMTPMPLTYNILTQGFHQGTLKVTTSVENITIKTKVYPNPTTQYLIIELEKSVSADLSVYDINGKLVLKDKLIDQARKELDFSFLKQGNYFLHINISDKKSIYQINKTK